MLTHQPIVSQLLVLLDEQPELQKALETSLRVAALPGITELATYVTFLDDMVRLIPVDRELNRSVNQFFYLIDHSPSGLLRTDPAFQTWVTDFCLQWGAFLDTPASAAHLATFLPDPAYHMDDFYVAPSGWLTFNQFFARQVRPGRRPIDALCDPEVVVSPADSVYQGHWTVTPDARIRVKGMGWSVLALLDGSPFAHRFTGGVFTHAFLNVNDYHRFHVPVSGRVLEARTIAGRVGMDVVRLPDGTLDTVDGADYQFAQHRGLLVVDSPLGLVAILPIGMAQVSSVTVTAEVGVQLHKGEEFGFFQFGGSDIVMLFEPSRVTLDAVIGQHYRQGRTVGHAVARG